MRYNLWDWQNLQPYSGPNQQFFQFCDALEVDDGIIAPESGFGLDHALTAWGSYLTNTYLPQSTFCALLHVVRADTLLVCGSVDRECVSCSLHSNFLVTDEPNSTCLGTPPSDSEYWGSDYAPNASRAWEWMTCNQFGFFQDSAPTNEITLVSRLVQPSADEVRILYECRRLLAYLLAAQMSMDVPGCVFLPSGPQCSADELGVRWMEFECTSSLLRSRHA